MKAHTSVTKRTQRTSAAQSQQASAGANGLAITPPGYGVEFVDRGPSFDGFGSSDSHDDRTVACSCADSTEARPGGTGNAMPGRAISRGDRIQQDARPTPQDAWHLVQQRRGPGRTGQDRMFASSALAEGKAHDHTPIQAKLKVNQPGDRLEREADATAERVMRMTEPLPATQRATPAENDWSGEKCSHCAGLQRKSDARARRPLAPPIVDEVLRSSGQPLDDRTLGFMESRFGHDFSRVRVHTDAQAAASARALGAHAYTVGRNMVFGRDEFAPGTSSGRTLIAHELAHVIQQTGVTGRSPPQEMRIDRDADEGASEETSGTPPASAISSQVKDFSRLKPTFEIDVAEGRAFANRAIRKMAPHGAVISDPPSDAIASLEAPPGGSEPEGTDNEPVQASLIEPVVQRDGGGSVKPEAGFVGSIQLCYDACNSELSVIGWVWAGGGVVTKGLFGGKSWWGAYVFAEREFLRTKLDFMPRLNCGTCAAGCKPEEGAPHWGGGIAGFPVALKPGERRSLKQAGIEVGVLISVRSLCDADVEIIALLDLTKYLGPIGAAVVSAQELANELGKKFNIEIECGIGVDVSGSFHLCKSVPGGGILGITSDSAKICGGGYVGCGIGLAHQKSALPGI